MSTKKIIENARRKGIMLHEDHKLVTRRDFLAAGIIPFAASIMAPTVWSMLIKSAYADCSTNNTTASTLPAFIAVALRGGAGLMANHVPITANGSLDDFPTNMGLMGLGSRAHLLQPRAGTTGPNRLETYMGSPNWFFNSGLLAGLRSQLDGTGIAERTAFIQVCVQSGDDTDQNRQSIVGLLQRANLLGTNVNSIVSGGFGNRPVYIPPTAPLNVGSVADLANAVSIAQPLGDFSFAQKVSIFKKIEQLSASRALALVSANATNASIVRELTECATTANTAAADDSPPIVDPSINNTDGYNGIWGINAGTNGGNQSKVFASCVYNTLKGQAGSASLSIGGYDYHDGTRTSGDARDREAGVLIGRILRSADASLAANQKCFIVLSSDGSVRSADSQTASDTIWTSDRGQAGTCMIFAIQKGSTAAPLLDPGTDINTMTHYIGRFTNGQSADMNYLDGKWSLDTAALAILANYLKFSGAQDWRTKFYQVAGEAAQSEGASNPLNDIDINKIIRFR